MNWIIRTSAAFLHAGNTAGRQKREAARRPAKGDWKKETGYNEIGQLFRPGFRLIEYPFITSFVGGGAGTWSRRFLVFAGHSCAPPCRISKLVETMPAVII